MPGRRSVDLSVVIPTRGRSEILSRTLDALRAQTTEGFETIVVVDGEDDEPPDDPAARVLVKEHGGPGAARNHGVRATERPLVLFLGDDMVPDPPLVERHLDRHARHPEPEVAVLGHVDWHPSAAPGPIARWMDWSGTQFDFAGIDGEEAGFGRFYSCNTSLKRAFFLDGGGFDEDFVYYYEDLDCGWRLHQRGMRLLYEPGARARHLHRYDWPSLDRRFAGIARGERLMAAKHEWFEPFFHRRIRNAMGRPPASAVWPRVVDRLAAAPEPVRTAARRRANTWYHQQLAAPFLDAWEGDRDLEELQAYLGDRFDARLLREHVQEVEREEEAAADEATFYRTSEMYLYDLTVFAMSGTKTPYLADLERVLPAGASVLDYGCGIGTDGLRLLDRGYRVAFADFDNPSTRYLRWRLDRRGHHAAVHDIDAGVPGGFDAAFSFDVIEHVDDPFGFIAELEARAGIVAVNFLEPGPGETHLHRPLPVGRLLDHAAARGLLRYRRHHGRSHLAIWRSTAGAGRPGVRSLVERHTGGRRPLRAAWRP